MYVVEGAAWEGDQRPAHPVPLPQALLACALVTVSPTHVRCVCGSSPLFTAFLGWGGMLFSLSLALSRGCSFRRVFGVFSQGFFPINLKTSVSTRACALCMRPTRELCSNLNIVQ